MSRKYLEIAMTESVCRAQANYYGRSVTVEGAPDRDRLGEAEAAFIAERDSFYLGSVSESGWPYVQHRGGPRGFLRVLDPSTLAFVDYRGNRQLISTGNMLVNNRVALFLIDYKNRERLKILGRTRIEEARDHPGIELQLIGGDRRTTAERVVIVDVVAFDWNCPTHITPRYSIEDVEELVGPLKARVAELEAQLRTV